MIQSDSLANNVEKQDKPSKVRRITMIEAFFLNLHQICDSPSLTLHLGKSIILYSSSHRYFLDLFSLSYICIIFTLGTLEGQYFAALNHSSFFESSDLVDELM